MHVVASERAEHYRVLCGLPEFNSEHSLGVSQELRLCQELARAEAAICSDRNSLTGKVERITLASVQGRITSLDEAENMPDLNQELLEFLMNANYVVELRSRLARMTKRDLGGL